MKKKYEKLFDIYPEYITLNRLCTICGISKRSAAYLLNYGIIPSIQNDNKTWRYKIKLSDVIKYLRRREQWGSQIPKGKMNSKKAKNPRRSFSQIVSSEERKDIRLFFVQESKECPDVLTVAEIAALTGLNRETVRRFVSSGELEPVMKEPKIMIPKKRVLDFVTSQRFIDFCSNSKDFIAILGGYQEWKTAK